MGKPSIFVLLLVQLCSRSALAQAPFPDVGAEMLKIEYLSTILPQVLASQQRSWLLDTLFPGIEGWLIMSEGYTGPSFGEVMLDLLEAKRQINLSLLIAVSQAASACAAAYDPKLQAELAHWVDFAFRNSPHLSTGPGFQLDAYQKLAATCAEFLVNFDTTVATPRPGGGVVRLQLHSSFPLRTIRTDKTVSFNGSGPLEYTHVEWSSSPGCTTTVTTEPGGMRVTAADLPIASNSDGKLHSLNSLTISFSQPHETVDISCSNGGMHQGPLSTWSLLWNLHYMTETAPDGSGYFIKPWSASSPDAFATWQYINRGTDSPEHSTETTTIAVVRRATAP